MSSQPSLRQAGSRGIYKQTNKSRRYCCLQVRGPICWEGTEGLPWNMRQYREREEAVLKANTLGCSWGYGKVWALGEELRALLGWRQSRAESQVFQHCRAEPGRETRSKVSSPQGPASRQLPVQSSRTSCSPRALRAERKLLILQAGAAFLIWAGKGCQLCADSQSKVGSCKPFCLATPAWAPGHRGWGTLSSNSLLLL